MEEEIKKEERTESAEEIKPQERTESAEKIKQQERTESAEEIKPQEQTEAVEDFEEENVEAEGFEDEGDWEDEEPEQEAVKPWKMVLVFCGLILLAALICVVLWKVTHSDSDDVQNQNGIASVGEPSSEPSTAGSEGRQPESTAEPSTAGSEGQQPESTAEPSTAGSEGQRPESTPEPSTAGNEGQRPANTAEPPSTGSDASGSATAQPVQEDKNRFVTQDGRTVIFTDCDDIISPKEYVNLRTEPSTSQGNDTVSCRLNYGENAHRTGFSADAGWSRVEYDGKVLYVVTSYVFVVEEEQTAE